MYLCTVKFRKKMIKVYFEDANLEDYVKEGRSNVKPY